MAADFDSLFFYPLHAPPTDSSSSSILDVELTAEETVVLEGYLLVWIVTTVLGIGAMVYQCRRLRILLRERRLERQQQRDQPNTFHTADTALDADDLIVVEQHNLQELERERADHVRLTNELKAATKMQSTVRAQLHQLKSALSTMQQQQQQTTRDQASRNEPVRPEARRELDETTTTTTTVPTIITNKKRVRKPLVKPSIEAISKKSD